MTPAELLEFQRTAERTKFFEKLREVAREDNNSDKRTSIRLTSEDLSQDLKCHLKDIGYKIEDDAVNVTISWKKGAEE
jgi:hypothetical protein